MNTNDSKNVKVLAETSCIKNPHFNIFYQYLCLLAKKKTFFKFIKDKREIGVILLAAIFL